MKEEKSKDNDNEYVKKLGGEFLIVDKKIAHKPDFLDNLMKFQYGEGEDSDKGFKEMKRIIKEEKLEKNLSLILDNSKESDLAVKYLNEEEIDFNVQTKVSKDGLFDFLSRSTIAFANSMSQNEFPTLTVNAPDLITGVKSYISLGGVKNYLREKIFEDLKIKKFNDCWREIKTFYCEQDYDPKNKSGKRKELVTCFNRLGEKIYEGFMKKAPHQLRSPLDKHDFHDWDEVGSQEIDSLDKLFKKRDKKGKIIDLETKTILFPDEVDILKKDGLVIMRDDRSEYHVTYEACFNDKGFIYKVYAQMFD